MGSYDTILGTLLMGIFFNTFLYGLVTYQFAVYYRTNFGDGPATKYTVIFLFILDTCHSVSAIYMAWFYAVENYGNASGLAANVWPYPFTAVGNTLAATVTQIYLGIWCLTNSKILYGTVMVLVIPSFILGFVCGTEAWIIRTTSELHRLTPLVIAWLSISVTLDTFISVTLVIIFSRSRTGFSKMDTILDRLIRGAVQTGFLASIFVLGDLITFVVLPRDNFYGMFAIPLGRIYTNTFLDTLLTRESLKAKMDGTDHANGGLSSIRWTGVDPSPTNSTTETSIQEKIALGLRSSHEGGELGMVRLDI